MVFRLFWRTTVSSENYLRKSFVRLIFYLFCLTWFYESCWLKASLPCKLFVSLSSKHNMYIIRACGQWVKQIDSCFPPVKCTKTLLAIRIEDSQFVHKQPSKQPRIDTTIGHCAYDQCSVISDFLGPPWPPQIFVSLSAYCVHQQRFIGEVSLSVETQGYIHTSTCTFRVFEVWVFEVWVFEVWVFEVWGFEVWGFEVWAFEVWGFEVWAFEVWAFVKPLM